MSKYNSRFLGTPSKSGYESSGYGHGYANAASATAASATAASSEPTFLTEPYETEFGSASTSATLTTTRNVQWATAVSERKTKTVPLAAKTSGSSTSAVATATPTTATLVWGRSGANMDKRIGMGQGGVAPTHDLEYGEIEGTLPDELDGHSLNRFSVDLYVLYGKGGNNNHSLVVCYEDDMNVEGQSYLMDFLRDYHMDPNGARTQLSYLIDDNFCGLGSGFTLHRKKLDMLVSTLVIAKGATKSFKECFSRSCKKLLNFKKGVEEARNRYHRAELLAANVVNSYNTVDESTQIKSVGDLLSYSATDSINHLKSRLMAHGVWSMEYFEGIDKKIQKDDVEGIFYPVFLLMDSLLKDELWRGCLPTTEEKLKITEAQYAQIHSNTRLCLLDDSIL